MRLVLLHGFSDAGTCWVPWLPFFEGFGEVVTPHARGHGGRPLPPGPVGAAQHVADLVPVLTEPSVLVGHSMGAATAALTAAVHPELVRAMVLEDPPWRTDAVEWDPTPYKAWIAQMQSMTTDERAAAIRAENPEWDEAEVGPWAESKGQVDPGIFDRPIEWLAEPWQTTAAAITVPALLLTADPELGGIVARQDAAWVSENTSIEVVTVEGAGHSIRRDQPIATGRRSRSSSGERPVDRSPLTRVAGRTGHPLMAGTRRTTLLTLTRVRTLYVAGGSGEREAEGHLGRIGAGLGFLWSHRAVAGTARPRERPAAGQLPPGGTALRHVPLLTDGRAGRAMRTPAGRLRSSRRVWPHGHPPAIRPTSPARSKSSRIWEGEVRRRGS